jgi:predicted ABC-type exoprotein transport system permease subunit
VYGPSGLQEYKDTLRQMREQKRRNEHRKQQLQKAIIEWTLGIVIFVILIAVMGGVFYYIGVKAGRF